VGEVWKVTERCQVRTQGKRKPRLSSYAAIPTAVRREIADFTRKLKREHRALFASNPVLSEARRSNSSQPYCHQNQSAGVSTFLPRLSRAFCRGRGWQGTLDPAIRGRILPRPTFTPAPNLLGGDFLTFAKGPEPTSTRTAFAFKLM